MEHGEIWAGAFGPVWTDAASLECDELAHSIEGFALGGMIVGHSGVEELPRFRAANKPLAKIHDVLRRPALNELIEEGKNGRVDLVQRHDDHDIGCFAHAGG
jgi:hypothetical protein